jgi:hypothetical protein
LRENCVRRGVCTIGNKCFVGTVNFACDDFGKVRKKRRDAVEKIRYHVRKCFSRFDESKKQ